MDERLEYQMDVRKDHNEGEKWQISGPSALSFESTEEDYIYSPQDQHVQYIPQKEMRTPHRTIPASWPEVLCFFRCYLTATAKCPCMFLLFLYFDRSLWAYLFNVIFKSLPHTYFYMFLASYAPKDHFYLPKMIPITYGLILIFIAAGVFDLMRYCRVVAELLDYTIMAIQYKNPWNRCDVKQILFGIVNTSVEIDCLTVKEIKEKIDNALYWPDVEEYFYIGDDGEIYNCAHVFYYITRTGTVHEPLTPDSILNIGFINFTIIWILITIFQYNCLYKRCIWKILHVTQWVVNGVYIIVLSHLCLNYLLKQLEHPLMFILTEEDSHKQVQKVYQYMDIDVISEATTAPPIIHILSSRIKKEIKPEADSALIIATTAIYYILKGVLSFRIKLYCEDMIGGAITLPGYDTYCFFYLWPMYFSTWYLGELCTTFFFILHLIMEFCCASIAYQCILEAILSEWQKAKRIVVAFVFAILGLVMYYFIYEYNKLEMWYFLTRLLSTMLEVFSVYCLYPVGRLIDDITFFSGVAPSNLRQLSLRFVPFYYFAKVYTLIQQWMYYAQIYRIGFLDDVISAKIALTMMLTFIVLGVFYACWNYKFKQRQSWSSLLKPDTNWGPEYLVRQLRKQYDSRKYISSQSPRLLSRFMFRRAEAKVYNLDIRYDYYKRTAVPNIELHTENEKKKNV